MWPLIFLGLWVVGLAQSRRRHAQLLARIDSQDDARDIYAEVAGLTDWDY